MHLVFSPKVCITLVSNFSSVLQSSQEKSKTMVVHFFLKGGEGGAATCIMVYVKIVNNGIKQIPDEDYCLLLRLSLGKCKSSHYLLSLLNTLCDVPLTLYDL